MEFLYDYKLFLEVRLSDVASIIGTGITFDEDINDKFLKYKTISKRIDKNKIRIEIHWFHTIEHDIIKKLKDRTSLNSISELNFLLDKALDELYLNYDFLNKIGTYSIWFSEYDFSIIIDFKKQNINIITIKHGLVSYNVRDVIELKTKL